MTSISTTYATFGLLLAGCSNPAQPSFDSQTLSQAPAISFSQALSSVGVITSKNEPTQNRLNGAVVIIPEDHRAHTNHYALSAALKEKYPEGKYKVFLEGIISNPSDRKELESWKNIILSTEGVKVDKGFDEENPEEDVLQSFDIDDSGTINIKGYEKLGIIVAGLETAQSQKANLAVNLYNHCLEVVETIHKAVKSSQMPIEFKSSEEGVPRVFVVMRNLEASFSNQGFPNLSSLLKTTNSNKSYGYKISPDDAVRIEVARKKLSDWMLKTVVEERNREWLPVINKASSENDVLIIFCGVEHVIPEATSEKMSIPALLGGQTSWFVVTPNRKFMSSN